MRFSARALPLVLAVFIPLFAAGCGGEPEAPPRVFSPPDYAYLTKLRLNVGEIAIEDHTVPSGDDLAAQAPTPPSIALRQMARDRLFAAGTSGRAVFVIDQSSIERAPNGALSGLLAIHLDLFEGGVRAGYAEARVARQHVPGSDPEDLRGTLYDLTTQMMADMNVELEFQVRKSLKNFLVSEGSVPLPVQAQPLETQGLPPAQTQGLPPAQTQGLPPAQIQGLPPAQAQGLPPAGPVPFATPAPLAEPAPFVPPPQPYAPVTPTLPPPQAYGDPGAPDQPPPQQMSPPPGYLQAPPGY